MLKPEILSVLWCVSIASFIFIAVKNLKIHENVEHVHAPKSVWVRVGEVRWGLPDFSLVFLLGDHCC